MIVARLHRLWLTLGLKACVERGEGVEVEDVETGSWALDNSGLNSAFRFGFDKYLNTSIVIEISSRIIQLAIERSPLLALEI